MAFLEFKKIEKNIDPFISLTSTGLFYISKAVRKRYSITERTKVKIFIDYDNLKIGIKIINNDSDEYSYKVKTREKKDSFFFYGKSIIKSLGLNLKDFAGRYKIQNETDKVFGELLILSFKKSRESEKNKKKIEFKNMCWDCGSKLYPLSVNDLYGITMTQDVCPVCKKIKGIIPARDWEYRFGNNLLWD